MKRTYVQHVLVYCHYLAYSGEDTVSCMRMHCIAQCGELDLEEANGPLLGGDCRLNE
jgi:hypothetical protein